MWRSQRVIWSENRDRRYNGQNKIKKKLPWIKRILQHVALSILMIKFLNIIPPRYKFQKLTTEMWFPNQEMLGTPLVFILFSNCLVHLISHIFFSILLVMSLDNWKWSPLFSTLPKFIYLRIYCCFDIIYGNIRWPGNFYLLD